jgi:hypothetical protein
MMQIDDPLMVLCPFKSMIPNGALSLPIDDPLMVLCPCKSMIP